MSYEPGTYAKGDQTKVATTAADAVALVWDGYKRVETDAPEAPAAEPAPTADSNALESVTVTTDGDAPAKTRRGRPAEPTA